MRITAIVISFIALLASISYADIYKYTDENGVICFTNSPYGKKTERVHKEKPVRQAVEKTASPAGDVIRDSSAGDYSSIVSKAASKYDLEPELIHAVIKTESNGNQRARSRKGAMGLMQLMPSTANDMNVNNPYNPEENIEGGTRYLKSLLEKFNGDLTLALAAYNAGPKRVEKYGTVPPISETTQYVKKVFALYRGKKNYGIQQTAATQSTVSLRPAPVLVYRIVLEDGTVLFTNSSLSKAGRVRF